MHSRHWTGHTHTRGLDSEPCVKLGMGHGILFMLGAAVLASDVLPDAMDCAQKIQTSFPRGSCIVCSTVVHARYNLRSFTKIACVDNSTLPDV